MRYAIVLVAALGAAWTVVARAEPAPGWIQDNLRRGVARAKRKSKPLMVVLRCVP